MFQEVLEKLELRYASAQKLELQKQENNFSMHTRTYTVSGVGTKMYYCFTGVGIEKPVYTGNIPI